jgi:hypothetical protein
LSHLEIIKLLLAQPKPEESQNGNKVKRRRSSPLVVSHQVEMRSMEMPRPNVEDLTFSKYLNLLEERKKHEKNSRDSHMGIPFPTGQRHNQQTRSHPSILRDLAKEMKPST